MNVNKNVCIIAANNIQYSPYIMFYTNILDRHGIQYDLIFPNRNNIKDNFDHTSYRLTWNKNLPGIINYKIYANKVIRILKKNKYKSIIVLTSINAVYLSGWLKKYYSGRYIVDIRDYTYEHNKVYYWFEKRGIKNAGLNIISSSRFISFLPENEYHVCHNISVDYSAKKVEYHVNKLPIVIGYVGSIGYKKQCIGLMKLVENDCRFEFHLYGDGSCLEELKFFAKKNKLQRTHFFGHYAPGEKSTIINKIDILFNSYGNDSPLLICALSNKLYDAFFYKKTLLTSPNTYMEKLAGKSGYSIDYSMTKNLDSLFEWYRNLDFDDMCKYQKQRLNEFINENKSTEKVVGSFLMTT